MFRRGLLACSLLLLPALVLPGGCRRQEPPAPAPVARPVKMLTLSAAVAEAGKTFPGEVKADQEVDLAFQVSGPLIELPVIKGQKVTEGDLLARIDPRDFENALSAAEATLREANERFGRIERLYADGNAPKIEYENELRARDVAEAEAKQAKKDLDDTYLRAKFTGTVADRYVENFQNVAAKAPILRLADDTILNITVNMPEQDIVHAKRDAGYRFSATFDAVSGREFELELKEFVTQADPVTQTYAVVFKMPAPEDVNIKAGMTATVTWIDPGAGSGAAGGGYLIPSAAVFNKGGDDVFVWVVDPKTNTVSERAVSLGRTTGDMIRVTQGLEEGETIATAGVHHLREGMLVSKMSDQTQDATR